MALTWPERRSTVAARPRAARAGAGLGVAAAALTLAACGNSSALATPSGTVHVTHSGSQTHIETKTKQGSADLSTGTKLPAGFPSAVPLPSGATLVFSESSTASGTKSFSLFYKAPKGKTLAVLKSYDAKLTSAGWRSTSSVSTSSSGGLVMQGWSRGSLKVLVERITSASAGSGGAELSISVSG